MRSMREVGGGGGEDDISHVREIPKANYSSI